MVLDIIGSKKSKLPISKDKRKVPKNVFKGLFYKQGGGTY